MERYARDLDGYNGKIVLDESDFAAAAKAVPAGVRDDIAFAHQRVRDFAQRQRDSLAEFEVELMSGLVAGQKLIPANTAGCYVPGGRYAHAASAIMSVCTAKVAGVPNIVATSPAHKDAGMNPAILLHHAAVRRRHRAGARRRAGVSRPWPTACTPAQPADIIVGPGNRFVAEAKRMLFGRVGIDVVAGPTESAIIADDSADADIVAADLAGQAEHGPDSPVWLFTTSRELGHKVIEMMPARHRRTARAGPLCRHGRLARLRRGGLRVQPRRSLRDQRPLRPRTPAGDGRRSRLVAGQA